MKLITRKNKLVLAELREDCQYILLVNPYITRMETIHNLQVSSKMRIQIVLTYDVNESIRFVEVPNKK